MVYMNVQKACIWVPKDIIFITHSFLKGKKKPQHMDWYGVLFSGHLKETQIPSVLYNLCKVLYIKKDTFAKTESVLPHVLLPGGSGSSWVNVTHPSHQECLISVNADGVLPHQRAPSRVRVSKQS